MFKLLNALKKNIGSEKQQLNFRLYVHGQLKIISMRTRMIFEQLYRKQSLKISQSDSQFKRIQASKGSIQKQYEILQQIGKKVIQVQTIKLYVQLLKKIQSYAPQIINTKGDVAFLRNQLKWFQCVLWYRKCKNIKTIQEFNTFCLNFFKGVDITAEISLKCELFKIFPGLQYLDDNKVIPLDIIVQKSIPFISFKIDSQQLNLMKEINQDQLNKQDQLKKQNQLYKQKTIKQNSFQNINYSQNINLNPKHAVNPNLNKEKDTQTSNQSRQLVTFKIQNKTKKNSIIYPNAGNKVRMADEQFAIDPQNNIQPLSIKKINPTQKYQSPNLNLFDWQALYSQQNNIYNHFNNSQLRSNVNKYSQNQSQYDQNTIPYPPSGILPLQQTIYNPNLKQMQQGQLLQKLDHYTLQPFTSYQQQQNDIANQMKRTQSKNQISFIESIQNQFFNNGLNISYDNGQVQMTQGQMTQGHSRFMQTSGKQLQFNINTKKILIQHRLFDEDQIYDQISTYNQPVKQVHPQSMNFDKEKKTFNRLFGFKLKSHSDIYQKDCKNHLHNDFSESNNQYLSNPHTTKQIQTSGLSEIDKMLQSLGIMNQNYQIQTKTNILEYSYSSDSKFKNQYDDEQYSQIHQLINSDKDNMQNNQEQNQNYVEQGNCRDVMGFNQYYTPKLNKNEQLQRSEINFDQKIMRKQGFKNKQSQQGRQVQMFVNLEFDLFDSLMIIKRFLGQQQQNSQRTNESLDETNRNYKNQSIQKAQIGTIKKQYMVSICARQEFINQIRNRNRANDFTSG